LQEDLFGVLCKVADEMLYRQIVWIKKLPFFDSISIKGNLYRVTSSNAFSSNASVWIVSILSRN